MVDAVTVTGFPAVGTIAAAGVAVDAAREIIGTGSSCRRTVSLFIVLKCRRSSRRANSVSNLSPWSRTKSLRTAVAASSCGSWRSAVSVIARCAFHATSLVSPRVCTTGRIMPSAASKRLSPAKAFFSLDTTRVRPNEWAGPYQPDPQYLLYMGENSPGVTTSAWIARTKFAGSGRAMGYKICKLSLLSLTSP